MKVTRSSNDKDQADERYALDQWDRTLRLCAIRLTERAPAFIPLIWLLMRR